MSDLDIGEVAAQSGLPASTLRYYETKGLIHPVGRNGLRRQYRADVIQTLGLITLGRDAGFSLNEVAAMFAADGQPDINRKRLNAKADELDETIKRLSAVRDGLRCVAGCSAPSHLECPSFLRLIAAATKGRKRKSLRDYR
ncbi:helix-turn-helix domain-containing protein [uncultured Gilvimarinus sp.]|uniref:helix-turn-helix domain-containing protein n=1 Tax=uncultured Gilvimarinus sp. TaxID=1689143 RepID=UPI0030DCC2C9